MTISDTDARHVSGMLSSLTILLFTLLLAPLLIIGTGEASWDQWRGDSNHRALAEGENPEKGEVIWSHQTGDQVWSSPVFYDGGMVIGSDDGWLYCFDPDSGDTNWKYKTLGPGEIQATALIIDNRAFFGSFDRNFYCIEMPGPDSDTEPSLIWTFETEGQIISSAHRYEDSVVFADLDGYVYRLSLDGEGIWKEKHSETEFWASPIVDRETGLLYLGDISNLFYGIDLDDGGTAWTIEESDDSEFYSSGCLVNDSLYICDGEGRNVKSYDVSTREVIWSFDVGHPTYSTPVVKDDRVYFGSWEYAWCIPASDTDGDGNITQEDVIWSHPTQDYQGGSSPLVLDDRVYLGSDNWNLYCMDRDSGEERWAFSTRGYVYSSPTIHAGRIYFGSADRNVYCIGDRPPGLLVNISLDREELSSDEFANLSLKVTDEEGNEIEGALVTFSPSAGYVAYDEKGNTRMEHFTNDEGELDLLYFPPQVSSRSTLTLQAYVESGEFPTTDASTQLVVLPGERGGIGQEEEVVDEEKERRPYLLFLGALIVVNLLLFAVLIVMLTKMKKGVDQ